MYSSVLDLHSYWAYGVLVFLLIAVLNSFVGLGAKRQFNLQDRRIAMIALIFSHVQLVLGFILLFTSPWFNTAKELGMGAAMKDSTIRLYVVEHPLVNIIAITLITIGWSKHKKAEDSATKFKNIGYLYAIGLVLLLSRIPYSAWLS